MLSRTQTQKEADFDDLETIEEPDLLKNQTNFTRGAVYGSNALDELEVLILKIMFEINFGNSDVQTFNKFSL